MRTVSTLVGLSLVALAATARAQEAAPAAPPAASTAAAPAAAQPSTDQRKFQLGLSLLSMGLGRFGTAPGGMKQTDDAAIAGGVGVSLGFAIIPGLTVGIAPQAIINVKIKEESDASKEIDLLARVAYAWPVVETIALYVEALPGYSFIMTPDGSMAKGLVLGLGAGASMGLTDRTSVNLGVGYQVGYQKIEVDGLTPDYKTSYLRLALGVATTF